MVVRKLANRFLIGVFVVNLRPIPVSLSGDTNLPHDPPSKATALFRDPQEMDFEFPVRRLGSNPASARLEPETIELSMKKDLLDANNITVDQVKAAWVEIWAPPANETFLVVGGGERIPLEMAESTFVVFDDPDGTQMFSLDVNGFNSRSLDSIRDDKTLVPEEPPELTWVPPVPCDLKNVSVTVTGYSVHIGINGILTTSHAVDRTKLGHPQGEGLLLWVVNPEICYPTLDLLTYTADVGGYRDLLWGLQSVSPGSVVLLLSLRDGSTFLGKRTRSFFTRLGSSWGDLYSYRDSWVNVFVKGGKTLLEALVPNLMTFNSSGSPIEVTLEGQRLKKGKGQDCDSWPRDKRWIARRSFCESRNGFSSLCRCQQPLDFGDDGLPSQQANRSGSSSFVPIVVISGNRTRHLVHLLESLARQEEVTRQKVMLVTDGNIEDVARIAFILGLRVLVHREEGKGAMKISRTLRFALWSSLRGFPTASAVIILEEDILLSADFYSYMTQLEPLFSRDRTLYCVNAFNHLSYPHTGSDPSLVYRVRTYPAYGWMMPRKILEEILPKWLPVDLVFEWDYFLGSELVRGDRECVVPDINRSFHWGTGGLHIKASYAAEVLYLSRSLNDNPPAPLRLDRILKENYEAEFLQLLKHALPVVFSSKEDLDTHARKGVVLSVFVSKEHERDESSFRIFASEMGIWTGDDRDHHNFAWRLTYAEATVLVIGVPISPYSSFMPKGYPLLRGSTQTDQEVFLGEFYLRASTRVQTHQNGSHLPPWGHVRPRKREPRTRQ